MPRALRHVALSISFLSGSGLRSWLTIGYPNRSSFIHGLAYASPLNTQGGRRMRESRLYGSLRGRSEMSVPTAIAIWAKYGVHRDPAMYERLVRISHWTVADVLRERNFAQEAS